MRRILTTFLLVALLGCASQPLTREERVNQTVDAFLAERNIRAAAVAVVEGGQTVHLTGHGDASEAMLFDLGSIRKMFVAERMVELERERMLTLDDPLDVWLYIEGAEGVTLRSMMHQMSGLPDEVVLPTVSLESAPGERWAYRNANFDLLDTVIETASGQPFAVWVQQKHGLRVCTEPGFPGGHAVGYYGDDRAAKPTCWFSGKVEALALAADTLLRDEAMLEEGLLNDGQSTSYGFGVDLRNYRDHSRAGHTGHMPGFTASVGHYPEFDLTIAVVTNQGQLHDPDALEHAVLRAWRELEESSIEALPGIDAATALGSWDAGAATFTVAETENGLSLRLDGYVTVPMVPVSENRWVGEQSPETARLQIDGDVALIEMVGIPWRATRR